MDRILLGFAFLFLSVYFVAQIDSAVASRAELRRFWKAQKTAVTGAAVNTSSEKAGSPDFRLWSQQRIVAYRTSLSDPAPIPLAILKVLAINLEVPSPANTTLNRAVGALHRPTTTR
jgi:hypothetical protein